MPRRITVRGTSGSGKSTFSAELARRLDLPWIELDALHHGPDWSAPKAEEFQDRVRAAMDAAPDGWVIDGSYDSKLGDLVLAAADTIVWLDPPFRCSTPGWCGGRCTGCATTSNSGTATGRPGATSSPAGSRSSTGRSRPTSGINGRGRIDSVTIHDWCGCAPMPRHDAGWSPRQPDDDRDLRHEHSPG